MFSLLVCTYKNETTFYVSWTNSNVCLKILCIFLNFFYHLRKICPALRMPLNRSNIYYNHSNEYIEHSKAHCTQLAFNCVHIVRMEIQYSNVMNVTFERDNYSNGFLQSQTLHIRSNTQFNVQTYYNSIDHSMQQWIRTYLDGRTGIYDANYSSQNKLYVRTL